ncbi:MAG: sugar ABC transporter ATP-binding protein [Planctomycetaceae bacterium]|nr:sugar ABC transporter ATP-binding protein [Planctomycetaceae bacterium]
MSTTPLIEFDRVGKRFGGVVALEDVGFSVATGSFHAICGENGAGKSTLMKILSGVLVDYTGSLRLAGEELHLTGPRDAAERGIGIIHQELNLVNDLTAAANLFLGRERRSPFGFLDDAAMSRATQELFQRLECPLRPDDRIRSLRIGDQQLVEIARAISFNSRILIMDEPTSALTEAETERLFRVIAQLREAGTTILYISHKMDEVFRLADTITVLRDGRVIRTLPRAETSPREITQLMVGRDVGRATNRSARTPGEVVLQVRNLSREWLGHARGWRLRDISFDLRAGEVVGVAGLMGAGRTELLECLYGASDEPFVGDIRLDGQPARFTHPAEAIATGVAMVTEDRKRLGIFPELSVREHITLSSLAETRRGGLVNAGAEQLAADESIAALRVKTAGREARILSLSGGNQQKCLIARALRTRPKLLLLDDPTRGIDVGAKAEIYELIDRLCRDGLAILFTSSELPELLTVCDRILVLCEGRLTAELGRDEFSEAAIMAAAMGEERSPLGRG